MVLSPGAGNVDAGDPCENEISTQPRPIMPQDKTSRQAGVCLFGDHRALTTIYYTKADHRHVKIPAIRRHGDSDA